MEDITDPVDGSILYIRSGPPSEFNRYVPSYVRPCGEPLGELKEVMTEPVDGSIL